MNDRYRGHTSPDPSPTTSSGQKVRADSPSERPLLLTVKEAAELMNVGRTTIYKLMDSGEVQSLQIGSSRRIPLAAIHEFADRRCRPTIDNPEKGPGA